MAKNVKRKKLKHSDPSELEVMKHKIRELEATVKAKDAKEKELMSKIEEFQMFKNNQVGLETDETDETQGNEVVDILLVFMDNNGLKGIAYKIFSFLDGDSLVQCRKVCRSWKNFIDNEWSMLQLQIVHLKRQPGLIRDDDGKPFSQCADEFWVELDFGPLFKIMEKTRNKPELRVFIKMCQEMASTRSHRVYEYMIDHRRHQELEILFKFPNNTYFMEVFKYACQYGCGICVKLLLDRSEGKEIDLNVREEWDPGYNETHEYEHCFFAALENTEGFRKEVVDLLLRSSEEKGIDINARSSNYGCTLRTKIIGDLQSRESEIEDYTEATLKILNIDPLRIQDLLSFLRSRRQ